MTDASGCLENDAVLTGGGKMGALVRAHDWWKTPLGAIQGWPQCLRSAVQLALDSPLPTLVAWGADLTCIYNDAYRPFLDAKPEALGRPFLDMWPEAEDIIGPIVRRALGGEATTYEGSRFTLLRHGAPEESWFDHTFSPWRDQTGAVVGVLNQGVETTARVSAEQARVEGGGRLAAAVSAAGLSSDFRALFEAAPTPLLVVAPPDWTIVAANDARVRVTGRSRAEVMGRKLFDAFPDDPNDPSADGVRNLSASLNRVLATRAADVMAVQRYAIAMDDGAFEERWWTPVNAPVLDENGGVAHVIHRVEDVTEFVRMRGKAEAADLLAREQQAVIERLRDTQAALTESETRYRRIVEGADEFAIITLDEHGVITGWNSGAQRIMGWSAAEAIGRFCQLFFTPEDREAAVPEQEMRQAASGGRALDERWHLRRDGTRFWGSGLMMPLGDAGGGFLKIFRDRSAEHARDRRIEMLARASAAILSDGDLVAVLDAIMADGSEVLSVDQCHSFAANGDRLELVHSVGVAEAGGEAPRQVPFDLPLCAMVAKCREPLVLADVQATSDPRYAPARAAGVKAYAGFPIAGRGQLYGVISFASLTAPRFDAEALSFLATLAQFISVGRERQQREAALSASEARYRTLFEALDAGFCIVEMKYDEQGTPVDYRFAEVNPAFKQQTGLTDAVGRWMRDLAPAHEQHWFDLYGRVARTGEPVRFESPAAALGERWYDVHAFRTGNPQEHRVAILFNDITQRRIAEERLRELNATLEGEVVERTAALRRYENIVQSDDAQVVAFDAEYRLLAFNQAHAEVFVKVFGHQPAVGEVLPDLFPADQRELLTGFMDRALAGETFTVVEEFGDAERAKAFFEVNYAPLRDEAGRIAGAFHRARDITVRLRAEAELAQAQEALRQSQKMEAMGQLTGGVAHDFNNLLTPIVGSLDMLQRRGLGNEREQRLIAGAAQSAERAKTVVQRLLAFARRQPLQSVPVDVAKLIRGMGDLVSSTTGPQIRVVVEAPDNLPSAMADANQLEMALLNLSVNSRDAMPDGGTLRITATAESVRPGHRSKLRTGHYVRLSVADTGSGMDAETLARAVEPFFSTKGIGKGTGLGLSMVHGLASQLGGALNIQSRPGLGTNVELWVPQSTAGPEVEAVPSAPVTVAAGKGTALLVDDEELVRMSTADMLADLGYIVVEAASAEEALRQVDRGERFDLVVTDHLMPGMTGTDLARTIRLKRPGIPVLVVSGYSEREGINPDLPRLTKPFRKDELASSLTQLSV